MGVDLDVLIPKSTEEMVPHETPPEDAKAHYINPPANRHIWQPGMTAQDIVDVARATQQEIVALCGYRWIPKYDPIKLPVCDRCAEIVADSMLDGLK